jgi:AcrR family transcriptional regulator
MRKSRPKKPRLNQQRRTRTALVEAVTEAVRRGETPTVAEAAAAAGISRATAYRYFPSQQALLLEVSLDEIGTVPDAGAVDAGPVETRVDTVIRAFVRMAVKHEGMLRTFLMGTMELWLRAQKGGEKEYPLRQGRRVPWLERALEPLQTLSPRQRRRLVVALSMLCGIESLIVGKDVCGCAAAETETASRWAAQAILRAALEEKQKD